jgi:hypothetical protein
VASRYAVRPRRAGGVVVALVSGFYGLHRVGRDPSASADGVETLGAAYLRWLSTFVFGRPGGIPWLTIAAVVGVVVGVLAHRWVVRRSALAGVPVVFLLLLEPVVRLVGGGRLPLVSGYPRRAATLTTWAAEALVGVALVVLVVALTGPRRGWSRRPSPPRGPHARHRRRGLPARPGVGPRGQVGRDAGARRRPRQHPHPVEPVRW